MVGWWLQISRQTIGVSFKSNNLCQWTLRSKRFSVVNKMWSALGVETRVCELLPYCFDCKWSRLPQLSYTSIILFLLQRAEKRRTVHRSDRFGRFRTFFRARNWKSFLIVICPRSIGSFNVPFFVGLWWLNFFGKMDSFDYMVVRTNISRISVPEPGMEKNKQLYEK